MRHFYFSAQGRHDTTSIYMEQFQNMVDVIEYSRGSIGNQPGILEDMATAQEVDLEFVSDADLVKLKKSAQERYLAMAFLLSSDRSRYRRLLEDLENDYLQGQDHWPKTLAAAFNLLTNWKHSSLGIVPISPRRHAQDEREQPDPKIVDPPRQSVDCGRFPQRRPP